MVVVVVVVVVVVGGGAVDAPPKKSIRHSVKRSMALFLTRFHYGVILVKCYG